MRIEILESARDDLGLGRSFYEGQREGLGALFLDSLFSDIEWRIIINMYSYFTNLLIK